jgi:hypothetical protein
MKQHDYPPFPWGEAIAAAICFGVATFFVLRHL